MIVGFLASGSTHVPPVNTRFQAGKIGGAASIRKGWRRGGRRAASSPAAPLRLRFFSETFAKRKTYLRILVKMRIFTTFRNLAKLVIAKPCESCETKVKLQNLYLRNLPKLVFAKLAKHDLRNNAKQCETLIAKIAKIEKHCERSKITKHSKVNIINTFTTGRLLRVARLC